MLGQLVTMVSEARRGGRALGAFNAETWEMAYAIVAAAERLGAPVALQFTEKTLQVYDERRLLGAMRTLAADARVPVALHLDHAKTAEDALGRLHVGFTSLMVDGSAHPFRENVRITREVVAEAHRAGLAVEGEIGHVGRDGEPDTLSRLTEPEEAQAFVEETGVDLLAVAIGTRHGHVRTHGDLDLERLGEIARVCPVPLVLHGGSGVPDEVLARATSLGMGKFNVGTELRKTYLQAAQEATANDVRTKVAYAMAALGEVVERRLRSLGWRYSDRKQGSCPAPPPSLRPRLKKHPR